MFYNSKTAIKGVISNNNWGNEQGSKVTVSGNDNSWADYKIVVDGTNLAVFRNNALIIFKANTGIKMKRSRRDHRLHRQVVLLRR